MIPGGHYEYLRVPFGLANAPRIFQKMMNKRLSALPFIRVFLDNILVFSNDESKHANHLNIVLDILIKNQMTISYDKSHFFQTTVTFLGHTISEAGLQPGTSRINHLVQFETPRIRRQLLQLLGKIN